MTRQAVCACCIAPALCGSILRIALQLFEVLITIIMLLFLHFHRGIHRWWWLEGMGSAGWSMILDRTEIDFADLLRICDRSGTGWSPHQMLFKVRLCRKRRVAGWTLWPWAVRGRRGPHTLFGEEALNGSLNQLLG